jgi:hypothetical protein
MEKENEIQKEEETMMGYQNSVMNAQTSCKTRSSRLDHFWVLYLVMDDVIVSTSTLSLLYVHDR